MRGKLPCIAHAVQLPFEIDHHVRTALLPPCTCTGYYKQALQEGRDVRVDEVAVGVQNFLRICKRPRDIALNFVVLQAQFRVA